MREVLLPDGRDAQEFMDSYTVAGDRMTVHEYRCRGQVISKKGFDLDYDGRIKGAITQ